MNLATRKIIRLLISIHFLSILCAPAFSQVDKKYAPLIEANLSFLIKHGWDQKQGVFYSELDNQGERVSNKIHTVALGRMIYALAYSSQFDARYLPMAKRAAEFQVKHLIANESGVGPYFIPTIENGKTQPQASLDIWQQTYGLTGLVELYRHTQDEQLLTLIHSLHKSYVKRFQDTDKKGFFARYDFSHSSEPRGKTLQSVMYPISGYLANLWATDRQHATLYETILAEHAQLAYDKLWSEDLGWPNMTFDENWTLCGGQKTSPCSDVLPGHSFQLALTLFRAAKWSFIDKDNRDKYHGLAQKIIKAVTNKPIWDSETSKGFFSLFDPQTNAVKSKRKSWWQHHEAMAALAFAGKDYSHLVEKIEGYYRQAFVDKEYGGEYFFINEDGQPDMTEQKGSKGKSSFHLVEMARLASEASLEY